MVNIDIINNIALVVFSLYCADCADNEERESTIGEKMQLRIQFAGDLISGS